MFFLRQLISNFFRFSFSFDQQLKTKTKLSIDLKGVFLLRQLWSNWKSRSFMLMNAYIYLMNILNFILVWNTRKTRKGITWQTNERTNEENFHEYRSLLSIFMVFSHKLKWNTLVFKENSFHFYFITFSYRQWINQKFESPFGFIQSNWNFFDILNCTYDCEN